MKRVIIIIILVVLLILSIFLQNNYSKSINEEFYKGLNGYNLEDISSSKVKKSLESYQNDYFISDSYKIILCDDVSLFEEYKNYRIEIDKILEEDPFCVIENLDSYSEKYDKVKSYYSSESLNEKDNRIIVENNKYVMYYKDVNFVNGEDVIKYDGFEYWLLEKDISKISQKEMLENEYVEYVGFEEKDNLGYYYYFDNKQNKEIVCKVFSFLNFVFYSEIEGF